jgi:two-component system, LytTR family, sensor kinase
MMNRQRTKKWLYHSAFWILYTLLWALLFPDHATPLLSAIGINFIYMVTHAGATYISVYWLIPRFLYKRRYSSFLLFQLLNLLLFSIPIAVTYRIILKDYPAELNRLMQLENIIPATIGSIAITVLLFSTIALVIHKLEAEKKNRELEKEKAVAELNYLKAQINPHFLFNTINNIYFLIKKDPEKAAGLLYRFSNLLRFQLYECREDYIPLKEELQHINDYLEIERIRKKASLQIKYQEDIEGAAQISPFILLSLFENAFKYVSEPTDERESFISAFITCRENIFQLELCNTFEPRIASSSAGIGLSNIRKRLQLVYPNRHKLTVNAGETVFKVHLMIQLHETEVPCN